jgi:hypothetical protein
MNIIKGIVDRVRGTGKQEGSLKDRLKAEYAALCAQRDAVNAAIEPIKKQIEALNKEIVARQDQVRVLVAQMNAARGGEDWLRVKSEIGALSTTISKLV